MKASVLIALFVSSLSPLTAFAAPAGTGIDPTGDRPYYAADDAAALPTAYDTATADTTQNVYVIARIVSLKEEGERDFAGTTEHFKTFNARLESGDKGKEIVIEQNDLFLSNLAITVKPGERVVAVEQVGSDGVTYALTDAYRVPALIWAALAFFVLALVFGRLRGLTSVLGLIVSAGIIVWFIVPRIIGGADPLWTSLVGAFAIATVSLFLAHGFNKRTGIAFAGTMVTLVLSAVLAVQAVAFTHLFGMGSEESLFVLGDLPGISLKGLLLGGIMLGLLGVLDDITTAQSAVVDELAQANPGLDARELYRRGLSVGREHIASLINTLFLAYAGVALPLFLLFSLNKGQPLWTIFNNELIAEEIVRTLVGSACLILAVPITTAFAAYFFSSRSSRARTTR